MVARASSAAALLLLLHAHATIAYRAPSSCAFVRARAPPTVLFSREPTAPSRDDDDDDDDAAWLAAIDAELEAIEEEEEAHDFDEETELLAATRAPLAAGAASFDAALRALEDDGVARVDGVLSRGAAAALRAEALALAAAVRDDIAAGRLAHGDVFRGRAPATASEAARSDLKLPLAGCAPLARALAEPTALGGRDASVFARLLERAVGRGALALEISALASRPGAARQPVHADARFVAAGAPLYQCFVALQDVALAMGPTHFLPRSHRAEAAHAALDDPAPWPGQRLATLAELVARGGVAAALLSAGDAVVYDSRARVGDEAEAPSPSGTTAARSTAAARTTRATAPSARCSPSRSSTRARRRPRTRAT